MRFAPIKVSKGEYAEGEILSFENLIGRKIQMKMTEFFDWKIIDVVTFSLNCHFLLKAPIA